MEINRTFIDVDAAALRGLELETRSIYATIRIVTALVSFLPHHPFLLFYS